MKSKFVLTLTKNSRGAVIGELLERGMGKTEDVMILATTHPATIAAALYATGQHDYVFASGAGRAQLKFPIDLNELCKFCYLLQDQAEADFISAFVTFSQVDFANPPQWDSQADIHFRTACHHIRKDLLKVLPSQPEPKQFKKQLKFRNKFIYFPDC
jgi:hypothetical protein